MLPQATAMGHIHSGTMTGKLNGRDAGGHAQRLELAPGVDGGADVLAVLALEQFGRVAGVLDVLDAALQLAQRVAQHLAVFGGEQGADLRRRFLPAGP